MRNVKKQDTPTSQQEEEGVERRHAKAERRVLKRFQRLIRRHIRKCSHLSVIRKVPFKRRECTTHFCWQNCQLNATLVGSRTLVTADGNVERILSHPKTPRTISSDWIYVHKWIYRSCYHTTTLFLNAEQNCSLNKIDHIHLYNALKTCISLPTLLCVLSLFASMKAIASSLSCPANLG